MPLIRLASLLAVNYLALAHVKRVAHHPFKFLPAIHNHNQLDFYLLALDINAFAVLHQSPCHRITTISNLIFFQPEEKEKKKPKRKKKETDPDAPK